MSSTITPPAAKPFPRPSRALTLLLVLYVALALAYNFADPLFEPPDESLHYNIVHYLQREHTLPVVRLNDPPSEYHQPPLYYTLAAVLTAWIPTDDYPAHLQPNPFWGYNLGGVGRDNKNQFLHGPAQAFPYRQTPLAVHLIRFLSTLAGVAAVYFTYCFALRLAPGNQSIALATAALVAFTPNFLITTSAVTNDAFISMLPVGLMLYVFHLLDQPQTPSFRQWALLSLGLSIAILTKVSGLPLAVVSAVLAGLIAWRRRSWRVFIVAGLILGGGVLLLTGWWFARNLALYGDLTGLEQMWRVWGTRPPLTLAQLKIEAWNFRTTYWANFGYGNVPIPDLIYRVIDGLMALGAVGLLWRGWERLRLKLMTQHPERPVPRSARAGSRESAALPSTTLRSIQDAPRAVEGPALSIVEGTVATDKILLIALWILLTLAALLWYLTRTIQVTGRQIYAILPALSFCLVWGWARFVPRRWHAVLALVSSAAIFALAVYSLLGVLIPAYRPSPLLPADQVESAIVHRLNWKLGDVAMLLGYTVSPAAVRPGQDLILTLYWQPLKTQDRNYTIFVHLFGEAEALLGARDTYPGLGNDPTINWTPGEIIVDTIPVPLARDAEGPILMNIEAGLYNLDTKERLTITDAEGRSILYPLIGATKLLGNKTTQRTPAYPLNVDFEGDVTLEGYDLSTTQPRPDDSITLTLYWASAGPLVSDYTVFVQLVDEAGQIVAQGDGPPRGGRYPTSAWGMDEHFDDPHTLQLPAKLTSGNYYLLVGLYNPQDNTRLLTGGSEADHVRLEQMIVLR
jgi:hypothetical protein